MLYQTEKVKMYIDKEVPCLVNEWLGFLTSKDFREAIIKLVELLAKHSPNFGKLNMLADTRKLNVVSPKDLDWINEEINPQYVKSGASFEAFVIPEDIFGEKSVKKYIESTTSEGIFTVKMFTTIEEAKEWLKEVYRQSPE